MKKTMMILALSSFSLFAREICILATYTGTSGTLTCSDSALQAVGKPGQSHQITMS